MGQGVCVTGTECRYGPMVRSTAVNGRKTRLTARVLSGTPTETIMRGSSKTIKAMATEFSTAPTAPSMRASGKTTFSMAKVRPIGQTEAAMLVTTRRDVVIMSETTSGPTEILTAGSGRTMR